MIVQISGSRYRIPRICACCCGEAQVEIPSTATRVTGTRVIHTQEKSVNFCYCHHCAAHIRLAETPAPKDTWIWFFAILFFWLYFIPIAIAAVITNNRRKQRLAMIQMACKPTCGGQDRIAYVGWNGTVHTFDVPSYQFAMMFMAANRNRLVNVPLHVISDLEEHIRSSIPSPAPEQADELRHVPRAAAQDAPAVSGQARIADEIRTLAQLRDQGFITSGDYEEKKRQLLGLPASSPTAPAVDHAPEPDPYFRRARCPNCQVPVDAHDAECRFCGFALATNVGLGPAFDLDER